MKQAFNMIFGNISKTWLIILNMVLVVQFAFYMLYFNYADVGHKMQLQ